VGEVVEVGAHATSRRPEQVDELRLREASSRERARQLLERPIRRQLEPRPETELGVPAGDLREQTDGVRAQAGDVLQPLEVGLAGDAGADDIVGERVDLGPEPVVVLRAEQVDKTGVGSGDTSLDARRGVAEEDGRDRELLHRWERRSASARRGKRQRRAARRRRQRAERALGADHQQGAATRGLRGRGTQHQL